MERDITPPWQGRDLEGDFLEADLDVVVVGDLQEESLVEEGDMEEEDVEGEVFREDLEEDLFVEDIVEEVMLEDLWEEDVGVVEEVLLEDLVEEDLDVVEEVLLEDLVEEDLGVVEEEGDLFTFLKTALVSSAVRFNPGTWRSCPGPTPRT